MLRLPMAEYDSRTSGDLVARVGSDTSALHDAVTGGTVGSVRVAIGAGVLAFLIDPVLFLLTVITFAAGAGFSVLAVRSVQALQRTEQDQVGLLTAATPRTLGAIRTVRSAGATDRERDPRPPLGEAAQVHRSGCRGEHHRTRGQIGRRRTQVFGGVERSFGHRDIAGSAHECGELPVRHLVAVEGERSDADRMGGRLVRAVLVRAHPELAAGELDRNRAGVPGIRVVSCCRQRPAASP